MSNVVYLPHTGFSKEKPVYEPEEMPEMISTFVDGDAFFLTLDNKRYRPANVKVYDYVDFHTITYVDMRNLAARVTKESLLLTNEEFVNGSEGITAEEIENVEYLGIYDTEEEEFYPIMAFPLLIDVKNEMFYNADSLNVVDDTPLLCRPERFEDLQNFLDKADASIERDVSTQDFLSQDMEKFNEVNKGKFIFFFSGHVENDRSFLIYV